MISKISVIDGFNLALDNAMRLHKIAMKSAVEGEFGIGCSLNILAAEEAIKAVACFARHHRPDEAEDFDEIFKSHKVKHEGIKALLQLVKNLNTIGLTDSQEEYFKKVLRAHTLKEAQPNLSKAELQQIFPGFLMFTVLTTSKEARLLLEANAIIKDIKAITRNVDDILAWLSTANLEKNNGFYVGLESSKWLLPSSFSSETFQMENGYTEAIIEFVQQLEPLLVFYVKNSETFHPEEKSASKTLSSFLV